MFKIDPSRLDLALEFRRQPFGEHSADLQAVLNAMRSAPAGSTPPSESDGSAVSA